MDERNLKQNLAKLREIRTSGGRWHGLHERLNAIQSVLRALARGDNIRVGPAMKKRRLNANTVMLHAEPSGRDPDPAQRARERMVELQKVTNRKLEEIISGGAPL